MDNTKAIRGRQTKTGTWPIIKAVTGNDGTRRETKREDRAERESRSASLKNK